MNSTSKPGLLVRSVSLSYPQGCIMQDLCFSVPRGETLAIVGPSGCGKSSLLFLLAGLRSPDAGEIRLAGRGGKPAKSAFVMQDFGLFPWKTVEDNLTLPLELEGRPRREAGEAARAILEELGLAGLGARYPLSLSGGQRQRVALGRALITDPDVLLLDEPFSSLDAITREHLQGVVRTLWLKHRFTCVLVTHNVGEAVFLGRHVMVLRGSPARSVLFADNPAFGLEGRDIPEAAAVAARIRRALAGEGDEA